MLHKPRPYIAALKIWLAGVLLGPVLLGIGLVVYELYTLESPNSPDGSSIFPLYALMILYGGFFSLPSALALWLVISLQYRFRQKEAAFWPTILTATFLLTSAPFVVFGWDMSISGWAVAYLGGIWLGVFWAFYRTTQPPEDEPNEPLDANL